MKMGCGSRIAPPLDKHGEIRGRDPFDPLADPADRLARAYQRRCRNAKSVRRGPHSGSADKIVARSMRVRLREQQARADLLRGSHSLRKPPLLRRSTPEIRDLSSILRCRERGAGGVPLWLLPSDVGRRWRTCDGTATVSVRSNTRTLERRCPCSPTGSHFFPARPR